MSRNLLALWHCDIWHRRQDSNLCGNILFDFESTENISE